MSATPVVGVGVAAPLGPAALVGLDHGGTTRRSRGAVVKVFAVAGAVEDLFVVAGAVEDLGAIAGAVELLAVLAVNGCRCQMWSWFKFLFFALESTGKQTADE
ncbi:hypothetical protein LWI29_025935 [Acer saccharum]|uniref:Uncharacterized protein n=1 Tax=Acer saccharum TaxID=4024 RepID=A0AA39VX00_ACESA|nr:hypothetical protein LWI29_025935 [Acer saccharum]